MTVKGSEAVRDEAVGLTAKATPTVTSKHFS